MAEVISSITIMNLFGLEFMKDNSKANTRFAKSLLVPSLRITRFMSICLGFNHKETVINNKSESEIIHSRIMHLLFYCFIFPPAFSCSSPFFYCETICYALRCVQLVAMG